MAEKSSRKELREPDKLVSFAQRFVNGVQDNLRMVIVGGVVVVLIALAFTGLSWYRENSIQKAAVEINKTFKILQARVVPNDAALGTSGADGTYASEQDKYIAALQSLNDFRADFGDSDVGLLADYYVALCQARLGKPKEAEEAFHLFLKRAGLNHGFAAFAIEGMGIALEEQGEHDKASLEYQRLTQAPFAKEFGGRGLYHQARMAQKSGQIKDAVRMYKELVAKHSQTQYANYVQDRLANLPDVEDEAKEEEPAALEEEEASDKTNVDTDG